MPDDDTIVLTRAEAAALTVMFATFATGYTPEGVAAAAVIRKIMDFVERDKDDNG